MLIYDLRYISKFLTHVVSMVSRVMDYEIARIMEFDHGVTVFKQDSNIVVG